jgi:hypothetical protein
LWDIALELERQALADEYFVSRRLYPNVDFYSGIIYNAMGFPTDMFPGKMNASFIFRNDLRLYSSSLYSLRLIVVLCVGMNDCDCDCDCDCDNETESALYDSACCGMARSLAGESQF